MYFARLRYVNWFLYEYMDMDMECRMWII